MSRAPSVSYPVERGRAVTVLLAAVWALAAALNLAWLQAAGSGDSAPWWGLGCVALATPGLLLYWRRIPAGELSWDGEQWLWTSRAYPAGVYLKWPQIVLDLQGVVIARTRNSAGAGWTLWLEARSNPTAWHGLRLALYGRPPAGALGMESGSPRP